LTQQLPGGLYLVRGNHDRREKEWYDDCRINLLESFLVKNGKFKFLFTHKPARYVPADTINIHGHLHNKCPLFWQNRTGSKHINVSVEAVRYRPVKLGEILEMSGFLN
jgi:calcineurin-like phosphoesterase family protein